jgi:PilZ domain
VESANCTLAYIQKIGEDWFWLFSDPAAYVTVLSSSPADYQLEGVLQVQTDEIRRSPRYPFAASAEVTIEAGSTTSVRVKELSLHGCYLDAHVPLSAKTVVLIKIFHLDDYFEAKATVIYSQPNLGMGLAFRAIRPDFVTILQEWLLRAMHDRTESLVDVPMSEHEA